MLVLFGLTLQTLGKVDAKGAGGVNLRVTAFRWQWQAEYPDAGVRLVGTVGPGRWRWSLPVGETVHVTLDSVDVNHSFYVPAFLFKRDAIPGVADRVRPPGQRARGLPGCLRRVLRRRPRADAVHDPRR